VSVTRAAGTRSADTARIAAGYYIHGPALLGDRTHGRLPAQGVAFAKAYAVKNGPIVLEMDTYRYHGHSMSDPGSTYRTRDEIAAMRQQRDPIEHVRNLLLEHAGVEAAELKKIEKARAHVKYQAVECQVQDTAGAWSLCVMKSACMPFV